MRPVLLFLILLLLAGYCYGQTCQGSLGAPVVSETFGYGAANIGPPLPAGVTDLTFIESSCAGNEATYTITNQIAPSCHAGTWQSPKSTSPNEANGYFMVINATDQPSVIFTERIDGSKFCPNAVYFFGANFINLIRKLQSTEGFAKPALIFEIDAADGTPIKSFPTGPISEADCDNCWTKNFGGLINAPADGSDLIVKIISAGAGGNGNDLAIDDITFSPCGPLIQAGFTSIDDNTPRNDCQGDNLNYMLTGQQSGYSNPSYQWQSKFNTGDWVNMPGPAAKTTTVPVPITNAQPGLYLYRLGVLDGANTSGNCRIYSDPLVVNVYSAPTITLAAATGGCQGDELRLSATGAFNYEWAGPNNYSGTGAYPVVSYNADPSLNGTYTVIAKTNGCPTFGQTQVTVYPKPTIDPLSGKIICEGSSVQLAVIAQNASHYQWSPSTGLDRDDAANPVASPAATTTYQVEAYNDGCQARPTQSVTVTVLKKPGADAGRTIRMFEGDKTTLNGQAKGDSITYYWEPADYLDNPRLLTPVTSATDNITYTLHVLSQANCGEATSSVYVRVYKNLGIPNTFTPNADGVNDVWNITNLNSYPNAIVSVYGRSGVMVYQSKGFYKAWDGSYNGAGLPVGSYYYVIDLNEADLPKRSGWVLLTR